MDKNQRNFNLYVFFSTFARNLIEIYIPIILYKSGYDIKMIVVYYLLVNLFSLILSYPCVYLSKKYDNRLLSIIGVISFCILQVMINSTIGGYIYIMLLAFVFALYRRGYWISRRYYNLKIIHKEDISKSYSVISIINQVGVIISSYVGSIFLDYFNLKILTSISIVLFLASVFFLYKLKFEHEKNDFKLNLFETIKKIPKSDIYLFGSYELANVVKFLFPIYLFLYVKGTYQTVGLLSLFTNLATMVFAYIYGRKINGKKNFLTLSIFLVVLVYVLKCNVTGIFLIIVSFLEGIFCRMHEISISKEFYSLSKKFEYYNYNLVYEVVQNSFRFFVTFIFVLLINDLKIMIYLTLLFMLFGVMFKFQHINEEDFSI